VVEQLDAPAVQQRQQAEIQIRLRLIADAILDTALAESLTRPFTGITVAAQSAFLLLTLGRTGGDGAAGRSNLALKLLQLGRCLLSRKRPYLGQ
jgi:hypothetical protein